MPIDELIELFRHYNEAGRYPNEVETQQLRECYNVYIQAVSKFLNGTVNVTYYSDDSVKVYPLSVRKTVGAYFDKTYPEFTVGYESDGRACAERYWSTLHLNWEG